MGGWGKRKEKFSHAVLLIGWGGSGSGSMLNLFVERQGCRWREDGLISLRVKPGG